MRITSVSPTGTQQPIQMSAIGRLRFRVVVPWRVNFKQC